MSFDRYIHSEPSYRPFLIDRQIHNQAQSCRAASSSSSDIALTASPASSAADICQLSCYQCAQWVMTNIPFQKSLCLNLGSLMNASRSSRYLSQSASIILARHPPSGGTVARTCYKCPLPHTPKPSFSLPANTQLPAGTPDARNSLRHFP